MFWPYGMIHPPTVRAVLGLFRRKPSGHVLTKSDRCICPVLCHVFLTQSSASVGLSQNLQRNLHVAPCVTSLRKRPPKLPKRNDTNQRHQKTFQSKPNSWKPLETDRMLRAVSLFFLVRRATHARHANDHACGWRCDTESLVSRALACTPLTEFGEKYRRLLQVESDRDHLCGWRSYNFPLRSCKLL